MHCTGSSHATTCTHYLDEFLPISSTQAAFLHHTCIHVTDRHHTIYQPGDSFAMEKNSGPDHIFDLPGHWARHNQMHGKYSSLKTSSETSHSYSLMRYRRWCRALILVDTHVHLGIWGSGGIFFLWGWLWWQTRCSMWERSCHLVHFFLECHLHHQSRYTCTLVDKVPAILE